MRNLKPAQRRKAIRKALAYLRKTNRANIRAQRDADGTAYTPRKQSNNVGRTRLKYGNRNFVGDLEPAPGRNYQVLRFAPGKSIRLLTANIEDMQRYKPNKRKMLLGFGKSLKTRLFGADKGVLQYEKNAVKLARVHHYGAGTSPARPLIGLSLQDRTNVLNIMADVLLLGKE